MEGYKMSFTARKRQLKKLIKDATELKFNTKLIKGYESELADIDEKLKEQKAERERFKEALD